MNGQPSPNDGRLEIIDALRGLAAFVVLIYHARPEFWIGTGQSWNQHGITTNPDVLVGYLSTPFSIGWIGVHIFFALSGYCIHRKFAQSLARDVSYRPDWRRFFVRRFLRIYPVYAAALVLTFMVDWVYIQNISAANNDYDISLGTFISSIFTLQGILSPMYGSNTVFWTLTIEMHLYLFYPVLFYISKNKTASTMIIFAALISTAYVVFGSLVDLTKIFPLAHRAGQELRGPIFIPYILIWAAGAYLAETEVGRGKMPKGVLWGIIWMTSLLAGIFLYKKGYLLQSELFLALGVAGFVHSSLKHASSVPKWASISLRPFVWLGLFSYSLYATHRVSFGFMNALGFEGQSPYFLKVILASLLSIVLAKLFFLVVERPSMTASSSKKTSPR